MLLILGYLNIEFRKFFILVFKYQTTLRNNTIVNILKKVEPTYFTIPNFAFSLSLYFTFFLFLSLDLTIPTDLFFFFLPLLSFSFPFSLARIRCHSLLLLFIFFTFFFSSFSIARYLLLFLPFFFLIS